MQHYCNRDAAHHVSTFDKIANLIHPHNLLCESSSASPKPYFKWGATNTAGYVRCRSLHTAVKHSFASPRQQILLQLSYKSGVHTPHNARFIPSGFLFPLRQMPHRFSSCNGRAASATCLRHPFPHLPTCRPLWPS